MTTKTLIYKTLKPITGPRWLLSGWRNRLLRWWVKLTCKHDGHLYRVYSSGFAFYKINLGIVEIAFEICGRCNRVIRAWDYEA